MRISVIIATRNEGANLHRTVRSIIETSDDLDVEIVVVDDGSTDDSVTHLVRSFPATTIVRHERSLGVSPARVAGVQHATSDVLVFLDAHVKPEPGCISRLVSGIELTANRAVMVPRVTQFDTTSWLADPSLRGFGFEITLDRCQGRWLELSEMRPVSVGTRWCYESPTVVGCCLAVHRNPYDHIMGFDPLMRTWGSEDVDFGVRAWMTGHPVLCDPEAGIAHRFVTEFISFEPKLVDLAANQIRMARKILGPHAFREWIAMRGLADETPAPENRVAGVWREAWAQYTEDVDALTATEAEFKSRRVMDEYEYAQRFNLKWPVRAENDPPLAPSSDVYVVRALTGTELVEPNMRSPASPRPGTM